MAAIGKLIFQGTRWQAVRVVNSTPMVFRSYPHDLSVKPPSRNILTVAASGRGRRWSATYPEAFWRDFAELDLDNVEAVTDFLRRRGDPQALLDVGAETNTGSWVNLVALLGTAARAWEPEDADGVSHITADPERLAIAEWFMRDNPMPLLRDIEAVLDPGGGPRVVLRAKTLATFMGLSAASALERRVPMRRCVHCRSWLEWNRVDTRFCSPSCRSLQSQARKDK